MLEDRDAKKSYLMTLMMLQEVDNEASAEEEMFVYEVGLSLGLTNEEIKQVKQRPYEIVYKTPESEQERMNLFYHLMFLMKIDGEIHEKEVNLYREIALRLGINPLITEEFIAVAKAHVSKPIPKDMLLNIIKKHMN